jgi:hypothetical protein
MEREASVKKLSPTAPLGVVCRTCHSKKKLKKNFAKALKFNFEQMVKRVRGGGSPISRKSNDSFESIDFDKRNKITIDNSEIFGPNALFVYLKSHPY